MSRDYPMLRALYPPVENPAPSGQGNQLRQAAVRPSVTPSKDSAHDKTIDPGPGAVLKQGAPGDMVDFIVYGVDEEDQTQEVHLSFRDEVVSGVYLKLRFEPAGLKAIFLVNDKAGRRWARAYGEQILARLATKGLKTGSVEIIEASAED